MDLGGRNVRTASYREMYDLLPVAVRKAAMGAFRAFQRDPGHKGLALHEPADTKNNRFPPGSFSARATMQFRAVARVDGDTNVWYWIGPHGLYDTMGGRR